MASRGPHAKGAEVVGAQGGACLEGAVGLTQRCGGAESAEGVLFGGARGPHAEAAEVVGAQGGLFGGRRGGAALAHGTEASSLRRARDMVTFSGAGSSRYRTP